MSHSISGSNVYPTSFVVPDDGDARNASTVNVPFGALADRTTYLKAREPRQDVLTAASGTWTVPADVTKIEILACGGGGSGAAGGSGSTAAGTKSAAGGSGGGGAVLTRSIMTVTPGAVLNYVVGAGGATQTTTNLPGNNGSDSTFNSVVVGRGAQGGSQPGTVITPSAGIVAYVMGGPPARLTFVPSDGLSAAPVSVTNPITSPQHGGQGGLGPGAGQPAGEGGASPQGFRGGAAGIAGSTSTGNGGGAGGGGGAGPFGNGADAGDGGNGSATGGSVGFNGAAAAANSGAGGAGGGAGGQGATSGGTGGHGGAGGSGKIIVLYHGVQAVFT